MRPPSTSPRRKNTERVPTRSPSTRHRKKKKEEHAKKEAEKKHEHTAQEKRIVETLHKVVANLHRADHDYDNQRHEAVEHVRSALHNLHAPDPDTSGKSGGMTQAKSDAILRDALGPWRVGASGAIQQNRAGPPRGGPAED